MNKFTPGSWLAKKEGVYLDTPWDVEHEDGHDASWAPISSEKGRTIALVVNDDSKRPMKFHDEEMHANACLIASAPELLKALEDLFADYKALADSGDAGFWKLEDNEAGKQAMAAISKAKGE